MPIPGPFELVIILVVILLLFGPSRVTGLAGALGKSVREFRRGMETGEDTQSKNTNESTETKKPS